MQNKVRLEWDDLTGTSTLAKVCDFVGITPKSTDVTLNPTQRRALIVKTVIRFIPQCLHLLGGKETRDTYAVAGAAEITKSESETWDTSEKGLNSRGKVQSLT